MTDPVSVGILGLGSYLPPEVRGNDYWADRLRPRDDDTRKKEFIAVERTVEGAQAELPPEVRDAVAALSDDLFRGARLRHVLAEDAEVSDMEAEAGRRISDFGKADSIGLGDAAAAMVVGAVPVGYGLLGHYVRTDGRLRDGVVIAPVVDGEPQRRWWAGCPGPFRLSSFDVATGKLMGVRSTEFCREACHEALRASGLSIADVALFICNQSLGWFVDACRRGLGLPADKAVDTFAEVANIAAAAVPLNLERARAAGRLKDGDIVLCYSPGTGFTRAAAVYRWLGPRPA